MNAFTTKLLPWCYPQEELPTTTATDAPQLLVSALLQFPRSTSPSSVGLKIWKQCVSFFNSVHLFRLMSPTDTQKQPLLSFLRGWKQVTHPLIGSSPPRAAESRAWHRVGGIAPLQSRNKPQAWRGTEMLRMVRALWPCSPAQSHQPRHLQQAPLSLFHSILYGQRSFEVYLNYSGSFLFAPDKPVPAGVKTD